ncbi:hypothetical protein LTR56_003555 [Elasticomyces elasticus]|nr:hypothetical protein LTR22_024551 [Elasticomyces elasticus]KAK3655548.1 hypothetical protein LTR56_003555 [Elasticomyces elasticus]KAK4917430.1 hypothetical protein LTR49_014650 [Elasticomyces elasticus]KAK5738083.1 hypothetical protein LTS12_025712 [Elasticomyces elasticus]
MAIQHLTKKPRVSTSKMTGVTRALLQNKIAMVRLDKVYKTNRLDNKSKSLVRTGSKLNPDYKPTIDTVLEVRTKYPTHKLIKRKHNSASKKKTALQIVDHLRHARDALENKDKLMGCTCPSGTHVKTEDRHAKACRMVPYGIDRQKGGNGYDVLTEKEMFAAWYQQGHRGPQLPYNIKSKRTVMKQLFGYHVIENLRWQQYVDQVGSEIVQREIWCRLTMKG